MLAPFLRGAFAAASFAAAFAPCSPIALAQTVPAAAASASPVPAPSVTPSIAPSASSSMTPSASPSMTPSALPSMTPSALPSVAPSALAPAGVVPAEITVELGGTVSPGFALARLSAAVTQAAQLQPGATAAVSGVSIAKPLGPGDALEAAAHVAISAIGYAPVEGTTAVHLRVRSLADLEPAFLFYSDDPESVKANADGVLYRSILGPNQTARVYAYHVSDVADRRIVLALHAANEAAVQVLGYAAGPADQFGFVGHISTLRYLLERNTQESFIAPIAAGSTAIVQLGYRPLAAGELVAGIFDLRVLDGGPVDVEVIATTGTVDPASYLTAPENAGDGHGRRGEFPLQDVPRVAFSYAIGDPEPSPFPVGLPTIRNLRPAGRPLGGDYGVLRNVTLAVSNPLATPQQVYFYEQPSGGTVTATIWFAGDPQPTEVPCVHDANARYLVKTIDLAAGESRTVTGDYMTDGSSSYPLLFGLTTVAPSPPPGPYSPDACNPRTPPPATTSPTASAAGAASTEPLPAIPSGSPSPSP